MIECLALGYILPIINLIHNAATPNRHLQLLYYFSLFMNQLGTLLSLTTGSIVRGCVMISHEIYRKDRFQRGTSVIPSSLSTWKNTCHLTTKCSSRRSERFFLAAKRVDGREFRPTDWLVVVVHMSQQTWLLQWPLPGE